jgi:hypothetical protein
MNTLIASNFDASKGFFLPATRITNGLTLEALSAIGITVDGDTNETGYRHCMLPEGWTPVPAQESNMQVRLQDGLGRLRAKIFYKPGSQGGGASMEVCCRFTTALKTNDTLQWAEVYDGNELIHHTATGTKTVDKMGYTERQQPQYSEADAWLNNLHPDHKNPLAYWN